MREPKAKRARTAAVAEPAELKCPITLELFRDPVSNCVGNTYERAAIEAHLAKPGAKRDPLTNEALANATLVPNQLARRSIQAFLDAHPEYMPDGWENRLVPPLPGAVQAALAEVAAAKAANSLPRLLAALSSLPNAVEVQVAGFDALYNIIVSGDKELTKQACGLVSAAMRNYRSHVKLQSEACWLINRLYLSTPHSESGVASGAGLVELVLAAAAEHAADVDCAEAVCGALASLLDHGEWACVAAEQGAAKAVVALLSAHADAESLQSNGICALALMVQHADWAAVQAEAGGILAAAKRGLSAARVAGSDRRGFSLYAIGLLIIEDDTLAAQTIATGVFGLAVKAMAEHAECNFVQHSGCKLLRSLAESPSSSSLRPIQLADAQPAVLRAMDAFSDDEDVQREGCLTLQALQPLIRRHLCDVVAAARTKFPDAIDAQTTATTIRSIAGALATAEPAPAAAAGAKAARELRKLA